MTDRTSYPGRADGLADGPKGTPADGPAATPAGGGPAAALAAARELTLPALRETVGRLQSDLARICSYHLGWCEADGTPTGQNPGKMMRAALTLLCARAFGADPSAAVPGAVAAELTHNFSLLHDDIMDADELRRGRPAAWVVFGRGRAVLAGDALLGQALRCLGDLPSPTGQRATRILVGALNGIIHGQAADLALEDRPVGRVTVEDYLRSCAKTTDLLAGCAELGATLGGATPEAADALREATRHLGLAWQISDDLESIWGDPDESGKTPYGDLRRRKKSFPVVSALCSDSPAGAGLAAALAEDREPSEAELRERARLVEEAGGRAAAERSARHHLTRALAVLDGAGPARAAHAELVALFRFVVDRHPWARTSRPVNA